VGILDECPEITQRTEQAMKEGQRLSFAFFDIPEFIIRFDLVTHDHRCG